MQQVKRQGRQEGTTQGWMLTLLPALLATLHGRKQQTAKWWQQIWWLEVLRVGWRVVWRRAARVLGWWHLIQWMLTAAVKHQSRRSWEGEKEKEKDREKERERERGGRYCC
jgi:hypothetical protein